MMRSIPFMLVVLSHNSIHAGGSFSQEEKSSRSAHQPWPAQASSSSADPGTQHWQLTVRKGAKAGISRSPRLCPHGIPNPALVPSLQMHGKSLGAGLGLSFPSAQDFLWGCTVLTVLMILKGYFEQSFKTPGQIDCSTKACPRHNLLSLQQIPQTLKCYTFQ